MNNFYKITSALTILSAVFLTGCIKNTDPANLTLNIDAVWNGEPVAIGDTVSYANDIPMRIDKFTAYVCDISLRTPDGDWINSESMSLVDFMPSSDVASAEFLYPLLKDQTDFSAIKFGLGVPSEINLMQDPPAQFPNEHPLGVAGSAGMYWTWASGYIFSKYEGKIENENGDLLTPIALHAGTNTLYREVILEFDSNMSITHNQNYEFNLELDLARVLYSESDTLSHEENLVSHTMNDFEIAERYVNLLDDAWSLK